MAYFQYNLTNQFDGNGGYVRVSYSASYDPIKNQTTVTFPWDDGNHRLAGNSGTTGESYTTIVVRATDSGNTASSAMNITITGNGGYKLYSVQPSPNTLVVQHSDAEGTKKITISASTTYYYDYTATGSDSETVTMGTYYPASSLTASNGTLGVSQTLTVNRIVDSYTHTITYTCGNASGTVCTKATNTEIVWTPPLSLASQNTSGTSVAITLTITTYSGNSSLGSKNVQIVCATPESVKPSLTLAVNDATGVKDRYGSFVKGLSMLEVIVTPTIAYDSPIEAYKITANGGTYTEAYVTTGFVQTAGQQTVSATVTDARNRSASDSVSFNVLDYEKPVISALSVRRCNSDGTANDRGEYVLVKFSAKVTALSNKNTAEYVLNYRKTNAVDWYGVALDDLYNHYTVTDYTCVIPAESASSYVVEVTVSDNHIATPKSVPVSTGNVIMHFAANGRSMAVGKICEKNDAFEVGLTQYDKFGALVGNGLAAYTGGGDSGIDPDTTLEGLCLTSHTNAPQGLGTFYYIHTVFYNTKSATAARTQIAYPYNKAGSIYYRYYSGGAWSAWATVGNDIITHGTENPDTTTKRLILTNTNTPMGSGYYMYIQTMFNGDPTSATYRSQLAIPYNKIGSVYHRYYTGSAWSDWRRHVNADEIGAIKADSTYTSCYFRTVDGVVEWLNPPMILDVEYRTVERWEGKPVYAKGIRIGYVGGSTSVNHGLSIDQPVHADVYNNDQEILTTYSNLHVTVGRTTINLTAGNAFGNIQVYLKYTKS